MTVMENSSVTCRNGTFGSSITCHILSVNYRNGFFIHGTIFSCISRKK